MNDDIALLFAYVLNENAAPPVPGDPEKVGLVNAMKHSVEFHRRRADVRTRITAQLRLRLETTLQEETRDGRTLTLQPLIEEVLALTGDQA